MSHEDVSFEEMHDENKHASIQDQDEFCDTVEFITPTKSVAVQASAGMAKYSMVIPPVHFAALVGSDDTHEN